MRGLACIAALALAGCGGGGDGGPKTPWVVMGSSSAEGEGASPGNSWAERLPQAEPARALAITNLARKFTLTYEALPTGTVPPPGRPAPEADRNTDRALSYRPQLVLLSFPSNDINAGIPAAETAANLRTMRSALAAGGAKTMVLGTQPRDVFTSTQRASQAALDQQLAADFGPCFVPLFEALSDGNGNVAPALSAGDGVHVNDSGHALIQQRISAALDGCLAQR